jgi:ADP-L-glycero-D-manno-heptose 6-epimerase
MPSERILVTGGAGFIGSALVAELNRRGHSDIIIADFLGEDAKWKNLVPLKYADYLEADTLRAKLLADPQAFGGFRAIYHLGACSATTEKNARYLVQNNYEFTKDLAQLSLAHGWRFVYASSAATYGDGGQGMEDDEAKLERLKPINMYGYSKHMFDLWAKRAGVLDKIVGVKYFNVFGPNEDHKGDMRSVVNKGFHQIIERGKVQLFKSDHPDYKDGEQRRDFYYVKDAVDATLHLGETLTAGGVFNLGSGEAKTWLSLMRALFDALGKVPRIDFIDLPAQLKGKYQYYTRADISKLRSTGYKHPGTPLEEAVADYVRNYLIPEKKLGEG